ncbi:MAG: glycosyltransferase family 2 protein [Acetobacteraceae bacterium]|nr:glycosyltransferase family 2 protein [Acetobacteraceae bacterium]
MITVLFATRDRSESVDRMLQSLLALTPPDGGWKLVVVDNGSRDDTLAVLERYAGTLPLTVLSEPAAGKNRALNRAIAHLEGDLTVLTDDDIIPEPDWLVQLQRAAASHPAASVFAGTVMPLWPGRLPAYLSERAVNYSILYAQNEQPTGACKPATVFGPNMAVRTAVFRNGFSFSEDVGPNNAQRAYVMGGETDFAAKLHDAGHQAWFVAESRVGHMVRPDQLTESWILRRYYLYGLHAGHHGEMPKWRALPRRVVWLACAAVARVLPPSPLRLRALSRDRFYAGMFCRRSPAGSHPAGKPAWFRRSGRGLVPDGSSSGRATHG